MLTQQKQNGSGKYPDRGSKIGRSSIPPQQTQMLAVDKGMDPTKTAIEEEDDWEPQESLSDQFMNLSSQT